MANPSWQPNTLVAPYKVIIDSNGNVQQAGASAFTTGSLPPNWATILGASTPDGNGQWILVAIGTAPSLPAGPIQLAPPLFIDDADGLDPNAVLNDMIADFQNATGRTLYPAQVERLLINLYAFRETLVRNLIQYAGTQNLLAFAKFPMLDYLGQLLGVNRLQAQGATTTLEFTLANALTVALTLPAGTQVASADGSVIFATDVALTIAAGATTGSVSATCTTVGSAGNGYLVGQIATMLAPNALISGVTNTTVTSGGSSPETDDHLRARIQLAPNQFSVAGPSGAYKFFAFGVDPTIIDVQVVSPNPGQVSVYVLVGPITVQPVANPNTAGVASSTLLSRVEAALSASTVRPLCDTVTAAAVTEVDYAITATVELYADADPTSTLAAAQAAAVQFAINLASRIARNIVPSEVVAALSVPGVYQVTLTSPSAEQQLSAGQWANCTAITLTFTTSTESS